MKKYATFIFAILLLIALPVIPAMAQATQGQEDQARAEYDAFMKAYNAANTDKNPDKTLDAAKDYLSKYPSGKYVEQAKPLVMWSLGQLYQKAATAKDYDKAFSYGKEILDADPNNVLFRYQLVVLGNQQFDDNKWNNLDEIQNETDKSEQLISSGPKPASVPDAQWNTHAMIGYLYLTRARVSIHNGKTDDALGAYKKAAESDPTNPYPLYLIAGVYGKQYEVASDAYSKLTDEQKTGDAGTAALDSLNKAADVVIDAYARFMAASDGKQGYDGMRSNAKNTLVALYTFRHKDKPDGWQDLVNQYKASGGKPGPSPS